MKQIGEIFNYGTVQLKVVPTQPYRCGLCYFVTKHGCCTAPIEDKFKCSSNNRDDKTSVIFIKQECKSCI